jgi:leucine dehydrogenase
MFDLMKAERLEALHFVHDEASGLRAVIAVHEAGVGQAIGGCRYLHCNDISGSVRELAALARATAYKAALAGIGFRGGRALILRLPHLNNRAALFESFGRAVDNHGGRFVATLDSGTSSVDMDCIARSTLHVAGTSAAGDSSHYTALGVLAGIHASALARLGSDDLEGLRVAIQGLGRVGYELAEQLSAEGAELLVADPDSGRVQLAVEQFGAHPVACEALLSTPCDILAPCGPGRVLDARTVSQLRCAAVAGAANDQLACAEAADDLEARGILYAPDYVINAGGLIFVALAYKGESPERIVAHLGRISERLTEIYALAQADKRSPARVADRLAERLLYNR